MIHTTKKGEILLFTELTSLPKDRGSFDILEKAVRAELEVIQSQHKQNIVCVKIEDHSTTHSWSIYVRFYFNEGGEVCRFFQWNNRNRKKFWKASYPESHD